MSESVISIEKAKRLIWVYHIISTRGSCEYPIGTEAIREQLDRVGLLCDRRTLYSDIDFLNKNGFEVLSRRGRSNMYFTDNHSFDTAELVFLIDAVKASHFITSKKTDELVDKIASLTGEYEGEILRDNFKGQNTVKNENEHIYYSVDAISRAIINHNKLQFTYFDYNYKYRKSFRQDEEKGGKKKYVVNPLCTVVDDDQYYLLCYDDKHKDVCHYRVDRMDSVMVLKDEIQQYDELASLDLVKYKKELCNMYHGNTKKIRFVIAPELVNIVMDKFKDNIVMHKSREGRITCELNAQVSPTLISWLCSFGNKLKVVGPVKIVNIITEYLRETFNQYLKGSDDIDDGTLDIDDVDEVEDVDE